MSIKNYLILVFNHVVWRPFLIVFKHFLVGSWARAANHTGAPHQTD